MNCVCKVTLFIGRGSLDDLGFGCLVGVEGLCKNVHMEKQYVVLVVLGVVDDAMVIVLGKMILCNQTKLA